VAATEAKITRNLWPLSGKLLAAGLCRHPAILGTLKAAADLFVVEGGDHSLKVLKRAGVPQARIDGTVQDEIARWLRERLRGGAGGC